MSLGGGSELRNVVWVVIRPTFSLPQTGHNSGFAISWCSPMYALASEVLGSAGRVFARLTSSSDRSLSCVQVVSDDLQRDAVSRYCQIPECSALRQAVGTLLGTATSKRSLRSLAAHVCNPHLTWANYIDLLGV
jgi:hypothetical protein